MSPARHRTPTADAEFEPPDALARMRRVQVLSLGMRSIPHLDAFLGCPVARPWQGFDAVAGWGAKPNTATARWLAQRSQVPFIALEDGFLRSVQPGVVGAPPLSLVMDDLGVYYDATKPSRLETWLATGHFSTSELARAERLIRSLRTTGLSKYNHQPSVDLNPRERERVLVVDQTAGDLSVRLGLPVSDFAGMLTRAIDAHPDAEILVKSHPDVIARKRRGSLEARHPRVRWLTAPAHPAALLRQVDRVYVMTSQMGFEALLHQVPVHCFGAPWYAGWGLTIDEGGVPPRRNIQRTLSELVAAAFLRYARYVDPETGRPCEPERIIEHLDLQRRMGEQTRGDIVCVGFSLWKRGFLPGFLDGPNTRVRFAENAVDAASKLTPGARLLSWGTREEEAVRTLASERGVPHWRMEDGFLRSVGLGSDLHAPASLVVDTRGLYYDPNSLSDIEHMLAHEDLADSDLERARRLREWIVRTGLSKYNEQPLETLTVPEGRTALLVVGQVEDDASIRRGCVDVSTNAELLRAARDAVPEGFLVFKPHPDVVSGNRMGTVPDSVAGDLADLVVPHASLAECLAVVDEVHTMTSLVGFEALLRGKRVVVYGLPFYAGWGLTDDRHPHPRRGRRRTLDELVAFTLIRYPRYVSRVTGELTTPEVVARQLVAARDRGTVLPPRVARSWPLRQLRKGRNLLRYAGRAARNAWEPRR